MRPKFRLHSHSSNPNITACTALWECLDRTVELNFTTNRAAFDMDELVQSAYTLGRDSAFKESATILKQAALQIGQRI